MVPLRRSSRTVATLVATLLCVIGVAASDPISSGGSRFAPLGPGRDGAAPRGGPIAEGPHGVAHPVVVAAMQHDRSAPLRSITPRPPQAGEEDPDAEAPQPLPGRSTATAPTGRTDPALQTAVAPGAPPTLDLNIEGLANVNGVLPPDTNGDIGPNDYVQWVNLSFAIYDRSGTKLYGPAAGNTLWTGFSGACATSNDGDPIAQYDHLADRWLMSQFALPNYPSGPFYQCIAVSTSGDPTGSWYRYQFQISATKLNDYPHFGVWPDAYYMSINQFSGSPLTWAGAGAVAFDRAAMLAGDPATMVYMDLYGVDPNLGGMLPSDLDGPPPPVGAPNVYVEADDNGNGYPQDRLDLWAFHVDWATPANSTFSHVGSLATAAFDSNLCNYSRSCIPQPASPPRGLDALSDRLMYRLQYRDFGDHQSLVLNHTVDVDGSDRAGIRWYELRKTTSAWSIYQQGTFSPDSTDRWLGSAAMDGDGNIALGYSVSSGTIHPSIRYTGRLAGDTLGTMTLGEGTIVTGAGSQTSTAYRWGDYAMLAVDSTDDCTFWFTNEYYAVDGSTFNPAPWQTRIAAFKIPGCGVVDTTPPTVTSFAPTTTSPTKLATVSYGLTFGELVAGLAAGDFSLGGTATGCSVNAPSGSGSSYTVAVSGCSEGTLALTLKAGSVTDLATNPGPATSATAASVVIDRTGPSLTLGGTPAPGRTTATSIAVTATFNEAVTGFSAADISVGGASNTATPWTVGAVIGGPTTFHVTVGNANPADGGLTVSVASGKATDAAGNGNAASNTLSYTIDRATPSATLTAPSSPTKASTLGFGVTFSEPVSGLAAGDFTLSGSATGCVVSAPAGSGAAYSVNVTGCSAGTLSLGLAADSVIDGAGNAGPANTASAASVLIDRTAPTTGTPLTGLRTSVTYSGTLAAVVTWTGSDAGGAGLATYDVERSVDGAAFSVIATGLTSPTLNVGVATGHTYRFAVRARDHAGNVGAWRGGSTTSKVARQDGSGYLKYAGTWHTATSTSYSGGSVRYSTAAGASVRYTFTGRSIAFLTTMASSRGKVKVYLDGVFQRTVDTYAASAAYRRVVWSKTYAVGGSHTIKLVVVGTAGRPRVDLDAFLVLK